MQTQQRRDDSDRQVALRIFGFLRGGRNGVKSDIREKDISGAGADTRKAHGRERGPIVAPVAEVDVVNPSSDDEQDDGDLDDHDAGIECRALLNSDHQNRGDHQRDQKSRQIETDLDAEQVRRTHQVVRALDQFRGLRAENVADLRRETPACPQRGSDRKRAPSAGRQYSPRCAGPSSGRTRARAAFLARKYSGTR